MLASSIRFLLLLRRIFFAEDSISCIKFLSSIPASTGVPGVAPLEELFFFFGFGVDGMVMKSLGCHLNKINVLCDS